MEKEARPERREAPKSCPFVSGGRRISSSWGWGHGVVGAWQPLSEHASVGARRQRLRVCATVRSRWRGHGECARARCVRVRVHEGAAPPVGTMVQWGRAPTRSRALTRSFACWGDASHPKA